MSLRRGPGECPLLADLTTHWRGHERRAWVGLSRPGEAGLTAVVLAIGALQDHGSEQLFGVERRY